jgi:hypothetical protein
MLKSKFVLLKIRDLKIQPIAAKDAIQATATSLVELKLV